MTEPILEVKNLVKDYGSFRAVDKISFNVPKGKVIGLLGPNGAGKTTTIQMLLGITSHSGGSINYFGMDFIKHRQVCLQRINFASAYNALQGRISVKENLVVFAGLYGVRNSAAKINELVDYFEISHLLDVRYINLSAGERTRVNLVKSLINDPELILMDEPTASLDPDIVDKTLTLIEELKQSRQLSILFTSHNMDEVTRICDTVIFLDHGKIVMQDSPLGLTRQIKHALLQIHFSGNSTPAETLLKTRNETFTFSSNQTVRIEVKEKLIPELIFRLSQLDIGITDIEITKPSLEDVFLQIARREK